MLLRMAALFLLAATASAQEARLPRYWTVHIDVAADRAAFEAVSREFSAAQRDFYAARGMERPPVMSFSTPDGSYYSLRPRGTFTDFDKPSPLGADAMKELQKKTAPISEATHKTLRAHHNEIWEIDRDLTKIGDEQAPKYALMRTDYVKPPDDGAYEAAAKQLCADLAARGVRVVAFFSTYGDGAYRYLFLSDQPLKVPTVGKLAQTHDATAMPRLDLSLGDPAHWLRY
jgi:hypothetical protein